MQMITMVEAVIEHATAHYEDGGWDVIVECWTPDDIKEVLMNENQLTPVRTPAQAIAVFEPLVDIWADRQADARNSAF